MDDVTGTLARDGINQPEEKTAADIANSLKDNDTKEKYAEILRKMSEQENALLTTRFSWFTISRVCYLPAWVLPGKKEHCLSLSLYLCLGFW